MTPSLLNGTVLPGGMSFPRPEQNGNNPEQTERVGSERTRDPSRVVGTGRNRSDKLNPHQFQRDHVSLQAVVLDLDETLAVVNRDRSDILADACEAVGAPTFEREAYVAAHENHRTAETREPIFADLLSVHGDDGDDGAVDPAALAAAYRDAIGEHLVPVAGAERLLDRLSGTYRLGLLTNGPVRAQRDKLDRLGWGSRFDAVVISGHLEAGKPDERAFAAVLDALDVPAHDAVHVGDQVSADVVGATAAGLSAVQVLYPGGPDPDPRADGHVDRTALAGELPTVLESLDP